MLEQQIIENCAPTLAALKTGNLFSCPCSIAEDLVLELQQFNESLNPKGVFLEMLSCREGRALIYAYRPDRLWRDLSTERVQKLLSAYGYTFSSVATCLGRLKARLYQCPCFPHEIGVFLGYPIDDVIGFIRHGGRNCKFCGLWKVYCNETQAQKTFAAFRKCSAVYARVFAEGRSIIQMTVAT